MWQIRSLRPGRQSWWSATLVYLLLDARLTLLVDVPHRGAAPVALGIDPYLGILRIWRIGRNVRAAVPGTHTRGAREYKRFIRAGARAVMTWALPFFSDRRVQEAQPSLHSPRETWRPFFSSSLVRNFFHGRPRWRARSRCAPHAPPHCPHALCIVCARSLSPRGMCALSPRPRNPQPTWQLSLTDRWASQSRTR